MNILFLDVGSVVMRDSNGQRGELNVGGLPRAALQYAAVETDHRLRSTSVSWPQA